MAIYLALIAATFFIFALGGAIADYVAPAIYDWFVAWRRNTDRKRYGRRRQ